ncbi:MAG TPA: glycerate kinase [Roseococcus sp.]|jgi:glycerate kinase|nr:glycerate kinase [Roseococcus sp.]
MRILVAPSGYKECLLAGEVAAAIAAGLARACPEAEVTCLPLVDGGEGFTQAMTAACGGRLQPERVTGPTGAPVEAAWGRVGDTAILDMASAGGLRLVPRDARNPLATTTRGVGELLRAALDGGARRILLGCGDSGTCDGGAGLAQALGFRLLDAEGRDLPPGGGALVALDRIETAGRDPRLMGVTVEVACNTSVKLCGPDGVSRGFGAQKGASPADIERLEAGLHRLAEVAARDLGAAGLLDLPGGGASGGLGAGLHAFLGARLRPWAEVTLARLDLDRRLAGADLVLTAEGGLDRQTARGKIPAEVARRAGRLGVPVIALAGALGEGVEALGLDAHFASLRGPGGLEQAMARASADIEACAEQVLRAVLIGRRMARRGRAAA